MASKKKKKDAAGGQIAKNPKALRDFHVLETFECGIVLRGTEVKSIRAGKINLRDAFCRIENGNAVLHGCDIQPYEYASHEQHTGTRPRQRLLHAKESRVLPAEPCVIRTPRHQGRRLRCGGTVYKSHKYTSCRAVGEPASS